MMHRLALCLALTCLSLLPASAGAEDLLMKDSMYYTFDDGIMSPEEMELEAGQIFRMCEINHFQRTYLDCKCLAGAFLIEREKRGPMALQLDIVNDITKNKPAHCANTDFIAGNSYTSCMRQARQRRAIKGDAAEYCTCVANKIANDFTRTPFLTLAYVQTLNYNSMVFCQNPENRPKTASSEAAKNADEGSARTAN